MKAYDFPIVIHLSEGEKSMRCRRRNVAMDAARSALRLRG